MRNDYEVLVIGGGPAGLSAAMTLGRLSRSVLICDDDRPRNAPSSHINNFISDDGIHPAEFRARAKDGLKKYSSVEFFQGTVVAVEKTRTGFAAELSSGDVVTFKKIILAYGVLDKSPAIEGFKDLWGKSIFHCPFCHGFEVRGQKLGYVATSELAFHALPLIHSLASELVVFTDGGWNPTPDQKDLFNKKRMILIEEKIHAFDYEGETLKAVVLKDGQSVALNYIFWSPSLPFQYKSDIGESLGVEKNELGFYKVNERGETSVHGVLAGGDITSMAHSVTLASASGVMAGSGCVAQLLSEAFRE